MTPAQEKKFDDMYTAVLRMEGKFNLHEERLANSVKEIEEQAEKTEEINTRVEVIEADRNKVIGVIWLSCSTAFLGALAFLGSLLKR